MVNRAHGGVAVSELGTIGCPLPHAVQPSLVSLIFLSRLGCEDVIYLVVRGEDEFLNYPKAGDPNPVVSVGIANATLSSVNWIALHLEL